jgi:hypothetical protein
MAVQCQKGVMFMKTGQFLYGAFCMFIIPALVFGGVSYVFGGESVISKLLGFAAMLFAFKLGTDHLQKKYPSE